MGPMLPPTYMFTFELIYTLIIIIFCSIIYFKTKEIYDLTKHTGISFFRNTFLFFALSYLVRFLGMVVMFYSGFFHIRLRDLLWRPHIIIFSLVTYFSYAAILSLVFSSFWKIKTKFNWNILVHGLALISTIIVFITGSAQILIGLQFILFISAIVLININSKKERKKTAFSTLHITYILLFIFWILNLVTFERGQLSLILNLIMNIISIVIFFIIAYRVVKRLSINAKKER